MKTETTPSATKTTAQLISDATDALYQDANRINKSLDTTHANKIINGHAYNDHGTYDPSHQLRRLFFQDNTSDTIQSGFSSPQELWNDVFDHISNKRELQRQIDIIYNGIANDVFANRIPQTLWKTDIDSTADPVTGIKKLPNGHIREYTTDQITICLRQSKFDAGQVYIHTVYGEFETSNTLNPPTLQPTKTNLLPYVQALPEYEKIRDITKLQIDLACDINFPEHIQIRPEVKAQPLSQAEKTAWQRTPPPKPTPWRNGFTDISSLQLKDTKSNAILNIDKDGNLTYQYELPTKKTKASKSKRKKEMSPVMSLNSKESMVFFKQRCPEFAEILTAHLFSNSNYLNTKHGCDMTTEWGHMQMATSASASNPQQTTSTPLKSNTSSEPREHVNIKTPTYQTGYETENTFDNKYS